jgi:hypothetical protein
VQHRRPRRNAAAGRRATPGPRPGDAQLTDAFQRLHRRLDTLERHAADQMFLQVSSQDLVLGRRRDFSERSRTMMLGRWPPSPSAAGVPAAPAPSSSTATERFPQVALQSTTSWSTATCPWMNSTSASGSSYAARCRTMTLEREEMPPPIPLSCRP